MCGQLFFYESKKVSKNPGITENKKEISRDKKIPYF